MSWLKKALGSVASILGFSQKDKIADAYDAQIKQQQEANKLNAANEATNVVQFEDTSTDTGTTDTRRTKKRSAGAYASALGLQL